MDGSAIRLSSRGSPVARDDHVWIGNVLAATLVFALLSTSLVVGSRRVAGHLGEPLSPIGFLSTGIIAATAAAWTRWLPERRQTRATDRRTAAVVRWLPGVALISLAAGVTLPGSSPVGLGLMWSVVLGEEFLMWGLRRAGNRLQPGLPDQRRTMEPTRIVAADRAEVRYIPRNELPDTPGDIVQRLVRTQTGGVDRIQGWLKATFDVSERNTTLHVAFCPPFDETPTLTVVQIGGPECRIKTGQVLSYGMRLELKRPLADAEQSVVLIEFSARAPLQPRAAENIVPSAPSPQSPVPSP
jgi:hypothetical protein